MTPTSLSDVTRLLFVALLLSLLVAHPDAQRPAPGEPHKALEALAGTWRFEGEVKPVPAVGANDTGKVVYTHVNTMTHSGVFLETRRTGAGPSGEVTELFVYGWDEASKVYRQDGYNNRGQIRRFMGTLEGRAWRFTGTNLSAAGRVTQERFTVIYSADMRLRPCGQNTP